MKPLGFRQRGRSRQYTADRGFWLNSLVFEPSRYRKGTYLSLNAHWFWEAIDPAISYGGRVGPFLPFFSAEQFAPAITEMAELAAIKARELDEELQSLDHIADILPARFDEFVIQNRAGGWPAFHAGVAAGLAGRVSESRSAFAAAAETTGDQEWRIALRERSRNLGALVVTQPAEFRAWIFDAIQRARKRMGFSPAPYCLG